MYSNKYGRQKIKADDKKSKRNESKSFYNSSRMLCTSIKRRSRKNKEIDLALGNEEKVNIVKIIATNY